MSLRKRQLAWHCGRLTLACIRVLPLPCPPFSPAWEAHPRCRAPAACHGLLGRLPWV